MTSPDKAAVLTREIACPGAGEASLVRISVDPDQFGPVKMASKRPKLTDKKFNLQLRTEDSFLLKSLAEQSGVSKAALMNRLLHDLLLDALREVEEEDARALIAATADARAAYDDFERPWSVDVGGHFVGQAIQNALEWNDLTAEPVQPPELAHEKNDLHSDFFKKLSRLLRAKQ